MNEPDIVTPTDVQEGALPENVVPNSSDTSSSEPNSGDAAVIADASVTSNLSFLLDAELEATIRFGNRQLLLRDILALIPGDVVELEQHINEPAQLIVSGRAIAKGEVVVVGGNFGLRITEVTSTSQRAEAIGA
jgi:flagellar motor switch protein FliN